MMLKKSPTWVWVQRDLQVKPVLSCSLCFASQHLLETSFGWFALCDLQVAWKGWPDMSAPHWRPDARRRAPASVISLLEFCVEAVTGDHLHGIVHNVHLVPPYCNTNVASEPLIGGRLQEDWTRMLAIGLRKSNHIAGTF